MRAIEGEACKDRITKKLVQRVKRNNIALVKHKAIDLVAAQDLRNRNVKTLINCDSTIDVDSCLEGVKYLLDSGIKIFDTCDRDFFNNVKNGDKIRIEDGRLYVNNVFQGDCRVVSKEDISSVIDINEERLNKVKYYFLKNTISYMDSELDYFTEKKTLPEIKTEIKGREVVIVSRGRLYREDLKSIKRFIINRKPVIISVDGGADAVSDIGLKSDIILGDMDSVSDRSLMNSREILVHSYCSGYAPGLNRVKSKNLDCKLLMLKGTSEDAAIYLAIQKGAAKVYLVGSHMGALEFLEKGRKGMSSTALLRILYGHKIIDLKGISSITMSTNRAYLKASIVFALILFMIVFSIYINFLREFILVNIKTFIKTGLLY